MLIVKTAAYGLRHLTSNQKYDNMTSGKLYCLAAPGTIGCITGRPHCKWNEVREISAREHRSNEEIRATEVRVVSENGKQLGIMSVREARRLAAEREVDLVEVSPSAVPPVCRLMDYGKIAYRKAKRDRQSKKTQRAAKIKEIRMPPNIAEHDIAFRVKAMRKFLGDGSKVRVRVRFKGREVTHPEIGQKLLKNIAEELSDVATVEQAPQRERYTMLMVLAPLRK